MATQLIDSATPPTALGSQPMLNQHYLKYQDAMKKTALEYYYSNKEHCLARNRAYKQANKERLAARERERRANKIAAERAAALSPIRST